MKSSTLPRMLFVALFLTTVGALAKQPPNGSDEAILASFKARGVRVAKNAVLDLVAKGQIDYVEVSFDKKSWDAASDLLATLKDVWENLALEFAHVPLTDDGLAILRGWGNLMFVMINDCDITDAGVSNLATLPRLRELTLSGSNLTDAALESFAGQQTPQTLRLTGRNFTDECVPKLTQLRGLEYIELERHGLTKAGVATLNKALPSVELNLSEPSFPGPRWHLDRSKELVYLLPRDWRKTLDLQFPHDVIVLPEKMGRKPNIVIKDQPGTSTLRELKTKYEHDLPNALKDFKLESSDLIVAEGGGEMVKLIHTNSTPGIAVRQVNYIVQVGEQRLFVTCTTPNEDGNRYDQQFDEFVRSIAKPGI